MSFKFKPKIFIISLIILIPISILLNVGFQNIKPKVYNVETTIKFYFNKNLLFSLKNPIMHDLYNSGFLYLSNKEIYNTFTTEVCEEFISCNHYIDSEIKRICQIFSYSCDKKNFLYPRKSFEYNLIKLKVYENNLLSDQKNLKKELNYFKDDFKHKCSIFFNQLQDANIFLGQKLSSNPMFEKDLDIDKWNSNYLNNVYENQKDNHLMGAYFANKHLIQTINCQKFDIETLYKVLNSNQKNNFIIILIAYFAILPIVYLFIDYILRFKRKSSRN